MEGQEDQRKVKDLGGHPLPLVLMAFLLATVNPSQLPSVNPLVLWALSIHHNSLHQSLPSGIPRVLAKALAAAQAMACAKTCAKFLAKTLAGLEPYDPDDP